MAALCAQWGGVVGRPSFLVREGGDCREEVGKGKMWVGRLKSGRGGSGGPCYPQWVPGS